MTNSSSHTKIVWLDFWIRKYEMNAKYISDKIRLNNIRKIMSKIPPFILCLVCVQIVIIVAIGITNSRFLINPNNFSVEGKDLYIPDSTRPNVKYEGADIVIDNSESGLDGYIARMFINIPQGAYNVFAEYESFSGTIPRYDDNVAYIEIESDDEEESIISNAVALYDNATFIRSLFWIKPFSKNQNIKISFSFREAGVLKIKKITVAQSRKYILGLMMLVVIATISFDTLLFLLLKADWGGRSSIILVLGIILFSCIPLIGQGVPIAVDNTFHAQRIADIAMQLGRGKFPVRYSAELGNGYGYIEHIMYAPHFLYPASVICALDFPIDIGYKIYLIILNSGAACISYFSFRSMFKDRLLGLLGCAIFSLHIFRLGGMYGRAALGEDSAIMFMPLFMYGVWKLIKAEGTSIKYAFAIIISTVGIIFSHVISCEILLLMMILFGIINLNIFMKRDRLVIIAKTIGVILLLTCSFLFPFIDTFKNKMLSNNMSGELVFGSFQESGLLIERLFTGNYHSLFSGARAGAVAIASIVLFFVALLCCKKNEKGDPLFFRFVTSCLICQLVALIFSTRVFPWDNLEKWDEGIYHFFATPQWSWRYLMMVELFSPIIICWSISIILKKISTDTCRYIVTGVISTVIVCVTLYDPITYYNNVFKNAERSVVLSNSRYLQGLLAKGDYVPIEADNDEGYYYNEVMASNDNIKVGDNFGGMSDKRVFCVNNYGNEGYIDVPIFKYRHVSARDVITGKHIPVEEGVEGRLRVVIPKKYSGEVEIVFEEPVFWKIADIISIMTAVALVYIVMKKSREINDEK